MEFNKVILTERREKKATNILAILVPFYFDD
jgi:hypothetical protein